MSGTPSGLVPKCCIKTDTGVWVVARIHGNNVEVKKANILHRIRAYFITRIWV